MLLINIFVFQLFVIDADPIISTTANDVAQNKNITQKAFSIDGNKEAGKVMVLNTLILPAPNKIAFSI